MSNYGERWTLEEESKLHKLFMAKTPMEEMATQLGRTPAALVSRLVRLGLLIQRGRAYHRVSVRPYVTFEDLKEENKRWTSTNTPQA